MTPYTYPKLFLFLTFIINHVLASDPNIYRIRLATPYPNQIIINGKEIWVLNSNQPEENKYSSISVISIDENAELANLNAQDYPLNLAKTAQQGAIQGNYFWTTNYFSGNVTVFDIENNFSLVKNFDNLWVRNLFSAQNVIVVNNFAYVLFSNFDDELDTYLDASIVGLDQQLNEVMIKELAGVINPKSPLMVNGQLVLASGDYQKNQGKIHFYKLAPFEEIKYIITGGTPTSLAYDETANELWGCNIDLINNSEKQGSRGEGFKLNLKNDSVTLFKLPFTTCGKLLLYKDFVFILGLNNGDDDLGNPKEHLFIYKKSNTANPVKKISLSAFASYDLAHVVFPSDMKVFIKDDKELLAVTLSATSELLLIPLDQLLSK